MISRTSLIVVVMGLSTAFLVSCSGRSAGRAKLPTTENVQEFMRAKLLHSQNVLEGLATSNFEMIAENSQEMNRLCEATEWHVLQTPEYVRRTTEFRFATEKLTRAANDKNLDGATLAYINVTMRCVACHRYVRGDRIQSTHQPLESSVELHPSQGVRSRPR